MNKLEVGQVSHSLCDLNRKTDELLHSRLLQEKPAILDHALMPEAQHRLEVLGLTSLSPDIWRFYSQSTGLGLGLKPLVWVLIT